MTAPQKTTRSAQIARLLLLGTLLVMLAGIMARLYFSDQRIRGLLEQQLTQTLQAPVELGSFSLNLFSGVDVRGFKVHAPDGLTLPPLALERFHIQWSLLPLLGGKLRIPKIIIENPHIQFEQTSHTDTLKALTPPEAPSASPAPTPAPPSSPTSEFSLPELPLEIAIETFILSGATLEATTPEGQVSLPDLTFTASLHGEGKRFSITSALQIGSPSSPAPLTLHREDASATLATHVSLQLNSSGPQATTLQLLVDSTASASLPAGPQPPAIPIHGEVTLSGDLHQQTLELSTCHWRVGDQTALRFKAALNEFLRDPHLLLEELRFTSNLEEFTPLARVFVPSMQLTGLVEASGEPLELSLSEINSAAPPEGALPFALKNISIEHPLFTLHDLNVNGALQATGTHLELTTTLQLDSILQGQNKLEALDLSLRTRTPSAPWVPGQLPGEDDRVDTTLHLEAKGLTSPAGGVEEVKVEVETSCPISALKGSANTTPITASLKITTGGVHSDQASLEGVHLVLDSVLPELSPDALQATLRLEAFDPTLALDETSLLLPQATVALRLEKHLEQVTLPTLDLNLGSLLHLSLSGQADQITSEQPIIERLALQVSPVSLEKVLKLLPPSLKPVQRLSGKAKLSLQLSGRLAPGLLLEHSTPPPLADLNSDVAWRKGASDAVAFLQGWVDNIRRRLPFHLEAIAEVRDLSAQSEQGSVSDLNTLVRLTLPRGAPRVTMELSAASLHGPATLTAAKGALSLQLAKDQVLTQLEGSFAELSGDFLPRPLENATLLFESAYQFGGDLLLEKMELTSGGIGVNFSARGVLSDPIQPLLHRAWLDEALPQVDAEFHWTGGLDLTPPLELPQENTSITGAISLKGACSIHEGLTRLETTASFDGVHLQSEELTLENLSGSFPLRGEVALRPQPHAAIIARELPFGSGKLYLVTDPDDIREDSARTLFQERLRAYAPHAGLHIDRIIQGDYELRDFTLKGQLDKGTLSADEISMHVLGGDIIGDAGLQVTSEQALAGTFRFQVSNMDASYFKALDLKPGPESELSTNVNAHFLFGPNERTLEADMNVTRIGSKTLDRFLQLLDPEQTNPTIQDYRKFLWLITIDEVAVWVRHENLNMDLLYTTFLRIPGTQWGFRPIDKEMIRRFSLSELIIDPSLQAPLNAYAGPLLGW